MSGLTLSMRQNWEYSDLLARVEHAREEKTTVVGGHAEPSRRTSHPCARPLAKMVSVATSWASPPPEPRTPPGCGRVELSGPSECARTAVRADDVVIRSSAVHGDDTVLVGDLLISSQRRWLRAARGLALTA